MTQFSTSPKPTSSGRPAGQSRPVPDRRRGRSREVPDHAGRPVRAVLRRRFRAGSRDRYAGAAGAVRLHGGISVRPDLLRPAMANTGCHAEAAATEALFVKNFSGFDYVVAPSGSCVHQVREHLTAIPQTTRSRRSAPAPTSWSSSCTTCSRSSRCLGRVPAQGRLSRQLQRAAGHPSRPALRDREAVLLQPLDLAAPGEGRRAGRSRPPDECCGFGGTFSVFEPAVSAKMGYDKVADQNRPGRNTWSRRIHPA